MLWTENSELLKNIHIDKLYKTIYESVRSECSSIRVSKQDNRAFFTTVPYITLIITISTVYIIKLFKPLFWFSMEVLITILFVLVGNNKCQLLLFVNYFYVFLKCQNIMCSLRSKMSIQGMKIFFLFLERNSFPSYSPEIYNAWLFEWKKPSMALACISKTHFTWTFMSSIDTLYLVLGTRLKFCLQHLSKQQTWQSKFEIRFHIFVFYSPTLVLYLLAQWYICLPTASDFSQIASNDLSFTVIFSNDFKITLDPMSN